MRRFRKTIRQPETIRRNRRRQPTADITVDLHGYTAEDAIAELSTLILTEENVDVLVVHGKGSGILRQRVRAFLRQQRDVKDVRHGENAGYPGGDGVTAFRL